EPDGGERLREVVLAAIVKVVEDREVRLVPGELAHGVHVPGVRRPDGEAGRAGGAFERRVEDRDGLGEDGGRDIEAGPCVAGERADVRGGVGGGPALGGTPGGRGGGERT